MLYDADTPEDYISQLDDDWRREKLQAIRAIIKFKAPQLEERIHYKMLGYGVGDNYVFHLNAPMSVFMSGMHRKLIQVVNCYVDLALARAASASLNPKT